MTQNKNTYFLDAESSSEMTRLLHQDGVFTQAMGGLWKEHNNDFTGIETVLDIGSGPGGWILGIAEKYPEVHVIGIDISERMTEYADSQAQVQGYQNTQFIVMDATKPLLFPENTFDFVNARFLMGFLEANLWPTVVQEFWRVLRPGGHLRLTESETFGSANSEALEKLASMLTLSLKRIGHSTTPQSRNNGIVPAIGPLLRKTGFQNVSITASIADYSYGVPAYQPMIEDWKIGYKEAIPFFCGPESRETKRD